MNPYKALIIEDDIVSACFLEQLLFTYEDIKLIGTASNAETGQRLILEHHPEIVFLDICLEKDNGIKLYMKLHPIIDWSMRIIINSSHQALIATSMELPVFDFLVKLEKTVKLTTYYRFKLTTLNRSKLTTFDRSKLTTR